MIVGSDTHSSVASTLRLLEMDPLVVTAPGHRLTGAAVRAAIAADPDPGSLAALVATCGTTNAGIIDDLASLAGVAREHGLWFHVDGAYGGAGLFAPSVRDRYAGLEHADSFVVDPHKWLFAPYRLRGAAVPRAGPGPVGAPAGCVVPGRHPRAAGRVEPDATTPTT